MALGETFSNSSIFLKICIVLMPLQTLLYVTGFSTVNNSGNFYEGLWKVQSCFMNQCVTADIQNVEGNTICPNRLFVCPLFRSPVRKFRCSWLQSFGLPSKSLNRDLYRVTPRVTLSHLKVCPNLVAFGVQWTHCLTSIPKKPICLVVYVWAVSGSVVLSYWDMYIVEAKHFQLTIKL